MLARVEIKSLREMAEAVEKSGALKHAEAALKAASEANKNYWDELRALVASPASPSREPAIRDFTKKEAALNDGFRNALAVVLPLRAEHAKKLKQVIAPVRRDAARAILPLIDEIKPHLQTMIDAMVVIERAGGTTIRVPPGLLNDLEMITRRLAG